MATNKIEMKSKNMPRKWKEKKAIHQKLRVFGCHRDVPLPEEFGEVVIALVAGDPLPQIYPVITMGALWGHVNEDGGKKIKNLATKYARCRKLDDLVAWERWRMTYMPGVHRPIVSEL